MIEGREGSCRVECPEGYAKQGTNTTDFNSMFCMEVTDEAGGWDPLVDVIDPECSGTNCVECYGPALDDCMRCSGHSFLSNGICVNECPRGTFEDK